MKTHKIKAICFDYYGTLVDVGQPFLTIKNWFAEVLKMENPKIDPNAFYMQFSKQRTALTAGKTFLPGYAILEKSFINTCRKYNVFLDASAFHKFSAQLFTGCHAFHDAKRIMNLVKGKYPIGLITNADNRFLYENIAANRFSFTHVISSETARSNKPQPEIFLAALQKFNLPANAVLMVGDSLTEDIIPARALGMQTVWINRSGAEPPKGIACVNTLEDIRYCLYEK